MMQKDKCLILSLLHSKMHSERSWNSFFTVSLYFSAGEYQCMTKTINNCTNCIFSDILIIIEGETNKELHISEKSDALTITAPLYHTP